jgi:hypothetical protein
VRHRLLAPSELGVETAAKEARGRFWSGDDEHDRSVSNFVVKVENLA